MTIPTTEKHVTYVEGQGIITTKDGEDTATFRGYGIGHSKGRSAPVLVVLYFGNHQNQQMEISPF